MHNYWCSVISFGSSWTIFRRSERQKFKPQLTCPKPGSNTRPATNERPPDGSAAVTTGRSNQRNVVTRTLRSRNRILFDACRFVRKFSGHSARRRLRLDWSRAYRSCNTEMAIETGAIMGSQWPILTGAQKKKERNEKPSYSFFFYTWS